MLVQLDAVPAVIQRERVALAEIVDVAEIVDAERRAAAIAELTKRAGLSVPVQNEATFYRADALQRMAQLVESARANGELPKHGRPAKTSELRTFSAPPKQRVAEGRLLAETGALAEAEAEATEKPDKPVSMSNILKRAKRREREDKLRAERQAAVEEARLAIAAADAPPFEIVHGDVADWRPDHADAIITDPPYITADALALYAALGDLAVDVLPEGGALVVMAWQGILPGVVRALDRPELAYRWCIEWRFANRENTVDHARRVFDCWKPVLVYHKGAMPANAQTFRDSIESRAPEKGDHAWGQGLTGFERLVASFSRPGETVCDPFLGGGTTAFAALKANRRFVGCDVDATCVNDVRRRLSESSVLVEAA